MKPESEDLPLLLIVSTWTALRQQCDEETSSLCTAVLAAPSSRFPFLFFVVRQTAQLHSNMRISFASLVRVLLVVSCLVGLYSCTDTIAPAGTGSTVADSSVIVVNQGGYQQDNSSLSRILRRSDSVDRSWFSSANSGRKLGANANNMLIVGDTAFISVTGSHTIEVINVRTGTLVKTLHLDNDEQPWVFTQVNSSLAAVSTNNADGLRLFNPKTLELLERVTTGPATQGIAATASSIFVANSGAGSLRDTAAGAGTISVVDAVSRMTTHQINCGKNVTELICSDDAKRVYAFVSELWPSKKQQVVEYDAVSFLERRRWTFTALGFMNYYQNAVYVLAKVDSNDAAWSVLRIDVSQSSPTPTALFTLPASFMPNGMNIRRSDGTFWICDAVDFASNGFVSVMDARGTQLKRFGVGLNPGNICFFH